jgi:HAD superfamily hydrolase (TIGR01484 family)
MNEKRNILKELGMFVTDVDGTLLGHRAGFDQCQAFRKHIDALRNRYGVKWVICTGRSLGSFKKVFRPMTMMGVMPDYVISRHAYIFERKSHGYLPHVIWNVRVRWLQWVNEWKVRRAIPRMAAAMLKKNPFARVSYRKRHRIAFQFEDEGAARFGIEIVKEEARATRYLQVFEYPTEVDVHAIPFTKGLAVSELARRLGMPADRVLVVGDGHNDISMMVPDVARWTACPANAASAVVEIVHKTGGHIAAERSLTGVLEVLDAYEKGELKSQYPASWVEGGDGTGGLPHRRQAKEEFGLRGVVIVGLALYVILLVMANFGLLPAGEKLLSPFHGMVDSIREFVRAVLR